MELIRSSGQIRIDIFPFENFSQKDDLSPFCHSFDADLATELSRFRQFRIRKVDGDTAQHADDYVSDYSIHGRFRVDGDKLRINIQLLSPEKNLVWGSRFYGDTNYLSELGEDVLLQVVGALPVSLNSDLLDAIRKKRKMICTPYQLWLAGMDELRNGSVMHDQRAREYFQKAIGIQRDYSLAYSGMSLTYFNEWSCQLWDKWDVNKAGAFEWAQKAIELDDQDYIAPLVLGKYFLFDGSYETSEYYFRKSLKQNSNDPDSIIQIAAYMTYLGHGEEAVQLYEQAVKLSPVGARHLNMHGAFIFFERGEFERAASLVVQSGKNSWADAEAYHAAIYFYLNDFDNMQKHWNLFLENFQRIVKHGEEYTLSEVIDWLRKINPHKKGTRLEGFLNHMYSRSEAEPTKISPDVDSGENYFAKDDVMWRAAYAGASVRLTEVKGFFDICKLLAQPGYMYHCSELMGSVLSSSGEAVFDSKARSAYQRRIQSLREEMQASAESDDTIQLARLQEEYDQLLEYLAQSIGCNGKARQVGGVVEKARSAVTWRIRNAIARIEKQHPVLGAHLSNSIKTGTFCSYQPERKINWVVS